MVEQNRRLPVGGLEHRTQSGGIDDIALAGCEPRWAAVLELASCLRSIDAIAVLQ
jgi:hypothetical protein